MKCPLDYSEQELDSLTLEELETLMHIAESEESKYNTEQTVLKLQMNSLYGALGNKWFPLFNESIACAITGNGRYFIRKLANYIEDTLQAMHSVPSEKYVIYGDTDSVYFQIGAFVEMYKAKNPDATIDDCVNWCDNFEKKVIQPAIQRCVEDFSFELNAYDSSVVGVEREIIADAAVFTEMKKYYARVRDSEGVRYPVNEPYIKVVGLDAIKSSTPAWSKKYLKRAIPLILDSTEQSLRDWIKTLRNDFVQSDLDEIAIVGGVSSLDYDLAGTTTVPMGSRAAIRHNLYLKNNNLENNIAPIVGGDKTKRIFLITPNKFDSNVIAFTNNTFTDEIENVDFDTQFEKGFLKPLGLMTNCLNYNLTKETASLDDW